MLFLFKHYTGDMYQHRNIHIDNRWLHQIHIWNSEDQMYLHNAYGIEDSINESSAAKKDTVLDSTATDIQSSTYIFTPGEGRIPVLI